MFISLCMIVKDEYENIKNCLDKALEIVDEAIVVDTGSTDGTLEILNKYNNKKLKIIEHKWNNDFSDARNKSIEFAKGDYILILDADERIFCDREKLEEFLKSKNALAYKIPIYNIFENKEIQITAEMIRLYKNQNPMYEGAIHEQITFNGEKNLGVVIDADICKIYHYGYSKIVFSEKDKQKRNMDIILSEIKKNPKDSFNWYNKGVMEMIAGDYDSALNDFIKSHKLAKNKRMAFHNDLIIKMIQCLIMQKKYKNAIEFMNPLLKDVYINTLPDLYYYLGLAYKELENYKMAERNFLRAIKIGDASQKNSKFGIGSYMPLVELARIQVKRKNIDNAIEKYREALLHKNNLNKYGLDEYTQFLKEVDKEVLINEFESTEVELESNSNNSSKDNNKMNEYKAKFKENIEQLIESGMIEEAEKLIDEYDSMFNQESITFSLRGIISTINGNNNLAISYFQKGLEIDKANFDLLFNLGYVYKNIGDNPKAIRYLIKAFQVAETIELEDEAYSILIELGIDKTKEEIKNSLLNEKYNENINDMDILKQEFKKNIETLLSQGLIIEAKELLSEYEKISCGDIDIYSIKGIIAMMEGNLYEAEKLFLSGLKDNIENHNILYNLGYLYEQLKEIEISIEYYLNSLIYSKENENREEIFKHIKEYIKEDSINEVMENKLFHMYRLLAIISEKKGNVTDSAVYNGLACKYLKIGNYISEINKRYNEESSIIRNVFTTAKNNLKRRYVILSSCGWADVYQRMHHIARSLSKFDNEVIYITPSAVVNYSSNFVESRDLIKLSTDNIRSVDGVTIYSPISARYNEIEIENNYVELVQSFIDTNQFEDEPVIITYMPYQVNIIKSLKGDFFHIYECVDDHSDIEYAFWGHKKDVIWEQELMDIADAITTTATSLFLQRRAIEGRENVYLSRNAVNESDFIFDEELDIPEDLKNIPEPRICYVGAVYNWFDTELFYDVVKSNPDKSFVIIGFGKDDLLKEKFSNLYILGPRKHSELKNYLKHMQIGIIPFKENTDIIINCDPIKQYEYIACGLPVITTFMPESAIGKINTFLANTKESFNQGIKSYLELEINDNAIKEFIIENSWDQRVALLCNIADLRISQSEKKIQLDRLKETLSYISNYYDSPIFKTLNAIYYNIEDNDLFEINMGKIYMKDKLKFIEKQYLTSLLINNNVTKCVNIIMSSKYVNKELKDELTYLDEINDINLKYILCNIYIGRIKVALDEIQKLKNLKLKSIYKGYIELLIEGNLNSNQLLNKNITIKNPLGQYLTDFGKTISQKNITLLIPTKNRPDLLESCLAYFSKNNCIELNLSIYVLDASDKLNSMRNINITKKFQNCRYFLFEESSSHFERIYHVSNRINTKYVCLCADDDYLTKEGIIKSIQILQENDDVVTVKGKSYVFLNGDRSKFYEFKKDSCESLLEELPDLRLKKLVKNWVPQLYYLVFRKKDIFELVNFIENTGLEMESNVFKEYLFYFMVPLLGKIFNIEEPLNVRDENQNSSGYLTGGFYHHILENDFNEHYNIFKNKLINFCNLKNINMSTKDIDAIFRDFLINSWNIDNDYIKYNNQLENNNLFDLKLLQKGFIFSNNLKPFNIIFIEISGKCNAKCKWCVTGYNNIKSKNIEGEFIDVSDFKKAIEHMLKENIISNNSRISLYNWGEPLLHPNLTEIIEYLNSKKLSYSLSTNASVKIKNTSNDFYRNLSFITFSMPGFSQNSYNKIHGFDFEKIKSNIINILQVLRNRGFRGKAIIAFHVYQFNLDEIHLAKEFAFENGLEIECSFAYINDYERNKLYLQSKIEYEELKQMSQELLLYPYERAIDIANRQFVCPQYNFLTINENLKIELCCAVKKDLGNIFDMDLKSIIKLKTTENECKVCNSLGIDYISHNPIIIN